MSIALEEAIVNRTVRRRRPRRSVEIAAARAEWKSSTLAAGLRCDRCGDAACVFVEERRFCGDCYLVTTVQTVQ